jgi:hypothetical protein
MGIVMRRNQDGRVSKKIDGKMAKVNFLVYYDIDGSEAKQVLRLDEYNGDDEGSWVLLEAVKS